MTQPYKLHYWPKDQWAGDHTDETHVEIQPRKGGYLYETSAAHAWLGPGGNAVCTCPDNDSGQIPCPHVHYLLIYRDRLREAARQKEHPPFEAGMKFGRMQAGIAIVDERRELVRKFLNSLAPEGDPFGETCCGIFLNERYLFPHGLNWQSLPEQAARELADMLRLIGAREGPEGRIWVPEKKAPDLIALAGDSKISLDDALGRYVGFTNRIKRKYPHPKKLKATLDPAQLEGYRWMRDLYDMGLGGILADEMGVGKSMQVLAFISGLLEDGLLPNGALISVPSSAIDHWQRELRTFLPSIEHLIWEGEQRHGMAPIFTETPIIVTTHRLLTIDEHIIQSRPWNIFAIDEAQDGKNPTSDLAVAMAKMRSSIKLPVTGTPVENSLNDLHTIMTIANPGLLGTAAQFNREIVKIAENDDAENPNDAEEILGAVSRLVMPFIMHRNQEEAGLNIPKPQFLQTKIELSEIDRYRYEVIKEIGQDLLATKGGAFVALTMMRQAACDPRLVSKRLSVGSSEVSSKTQWCSNKVNSLVAEGKKVILFSIWTEHLTLMENAIHDRMGVSDAIARYDGSMSRKKKRFAEDAFVSGDKPIISMTMRSGGRSLNLPQADDVIISVPWWNPFLMRQAAYRAVRRGQTKIINVHMPIVEHSIEERLVEIQENKTHLSHSILRPTGERGAGLKMKDIIRMIRND